MLKISRTNKQFTRLATPTFAAANILERSDLQEYIFNSPDAFCDELGQGLRVIAKEVRPSTVVADRIDLLAVDEDANLVIIELKRGSEKLQLLQAIAYVGMAAKWTAKEIRDEAKKFQRESIIDDLDDENLNQGQRILLVAEGYDYEVLVAAEWLYKKGVELDCVRVALAVDGDSEYLTFTQVFPTPELAEQVRKPNGKVDREPVYESWEDAYSDSVNSAAIDFFRSQIAVGCDNKLEDRLITLPAGAHKFRVRLRAKYARATQLGRFADDKAFWTNRLSSSDSIHPGLKAGKEFVLRFHLQTAEDFAAFKKAINSEVLTVQWEDSGQESFV